MPSNETRHTSDASLRRPTSSGSGRSSRKTYEPPRLEVLGDVREITLGATLGAGDSTPMNTQPF